MNSHISCASNKIASNQCGHHNDRCTKRRLCKYNAFLLNGKRNDKKNTSMDAKEIQMRIERVKTDIEKEVRDRLPRKVGITAVNHFRQNFRDAGWRDNGLHPWKKTRWQQGGGPDAKYTPLTSRRDHLMRSLQYEQTAPGEVTVTAPVPYAASRKEIFRNK